jgi:hypothetical protein
MAYYTYSRERSLRKNLISNKSAAVEFMGSNRFYLRYLMHFINTEAIHAGSYVFPKRPS